MRFHWYKGTLLETIVEFHQICEKDEATFELTKKCLYTPQSPQGLTGNEEVDW